MSMAYTVKALHLGTIIRKKSNMLFQCGSDELKRFPLLAFLVVGNGRKILIDTGGSAPDGVKWMPYERKSEEELSGALKAAGIAPEEIDAVFFTHLHWDHAGNNEVLPNARFYAQRLEYLFIKEGEKPGYERERVLRSQYELLDGDAEDVIPGISVLLTPGHSVGSQSIIVDTENGKMVIAGDLVPTYENLERNLPNGGNYNVDIMNESIAKIRQLGYPVIPGHDTEGWEF